MVQPPPPLQRRYSLTGSLAGETTGNANAAANTLDDVAAMKALSLDTTQGTGMCQLCEGGSAGCKEADVQEYRGEEEEEEEDPWGNPYCAKKKSRVVREEAEPVLVKEKEEEMEKDMEKEAPKTPIRTSSKRDAAQMPSPSTPAGHELSKKIRLSVELPGGRFTYAQALRSSTAPCSAMETPPPLMALDHPSADKDEDLFGGTLMAPAQPVVRLPRGPYTFELAAPLASPSPHSPTNLPDTPPTEPPSEPSDPPTTPTTPPLTFLTLPEDIRHHIYRQIPDLIKPYPLIYGHSPFGSKQPPLASTSRLIRSELLSLFYAHNTWLIKLEFQIMYDAFRSWILGIGDNARHLRLIQLSVRGSALRPSTSHTNGYAARGGAGGPQALPPPDGDACFRIDLSEKWEGGRVEVVRHDGSGETAGVAAQMLRVGVVETLWRKRKEGTLTGVDWIERMDEFLEFVGCRF